MNCFPPSAFARWATADRSLKSYGGQAAPVVGARSRRVEQGNAMKEAFGIPVPQTLEDVCDPSRLALLVYDMQVGIVGQLKGCGPVTARVAEVLEAARHAGVRTFFTRHMSLPRELMGAFQYRMAMAWQRTDDPAKVEPWFLRDSPGFAIVPELKPRPSEAIFDKLAMSAFEGTPLEFARRDSVITAVALP